MSVSLSYSSCSWSFGTWAYFRTFQLLLPMSFCSGIEAIIYVHVSRLCVTLRQATFFDGESACCLMNSATCRMKNGLDTIRFTTTFTNVSDWDHRPKNFDIASSASPRLKNLIAIVSRNWTAVLTPFHAALFPTCRMSTRVFSIQT